MLVAIYETGYLDSTKLTNKAFLKGLVGGLGGVVWERPFLVALLLWLLSLLARYRLLATLFDQFRGTVNSRQPLRPCCIIRFSSCRSTRLITIEDTQFLSEGTCQKHDYKRRIMSICIITLSTAYLMGLHKSSR